MRDKATAALLGGLGVLCLAGCPDSTVCEEAVDKLVDECELGGGAVLGGGIRECNDDVECRADCVIDSDCDDITKPASEGGPYNDCVAECLVPPGP